MLNEIKTNIDENEIKIYFTGPINTQAERIWNKMLKKELEKQARAKQLKVKIFLSQNMAKNIINQTDPLLAPTEHEILKIFSDKLTEAKVIITILDGSSAHNSVLLEARPYELRNKKIIGVLTDPRKIKNIEPFSFIRTLETLDIMKKCNKIINFCGFNEDIIGLSKKIINQVIEFCINSQ